MQQKPRFSPFSVGLGVIAAMLLVTAGIVLSGLPGGPKIGLPWASTFTVKAQLSDADALAPKAAVQIAGVKIGEVHTVDLQGSTAVVTMDIQPQYDDIHSDAKVLLRPHGLFGPKYIEIQPGTTTAPLLHDGDTISGNQAVLPVDLDQILQELQAPEQQQLRTAIVELGKAAAGRGTDFNQLVQAGNTLSTVLDKPLQTLDSVGSNLSDMLVNDEAFNASFAQTPLDKLVEASNVSLKAFADTSGQLGDLINHADGLLTNLDAAFSGEGGNIRTFLEKAPAVIDKLTDFNNKLSTFAGALTGADANVTSKSLLFPNGLDAAIENPWSTLSSYDGNCIAWNPNNPASQKPQPTANGSTAYCSPDGHFHYFKVQTFTAANGPSPASDLLPNPQDATAAGFSNGSGSSAGDLMAFGDLIGS